jgi:hypothetical protein
MEGHKASFINLIKVLGALVNPKGITNHLYKPNMVLKAVFHYSSPVSFLFAAIHFSSLP